MSNFQKGVSQKLRVNLTSKILVGLGVTECGPWLRSRGWGLAE